MNTTNEAFSHNDQNQYKNSVNGFKYKMEQDSLSQDLHFKMSKKIAQLTKVIYALNTKNDDNETLITHLKLQNNKEIQQILADTNSKVELLEGRLKKLSTDNEKLNELQAYTKSYEKLLNETKKNFEAYQTENIVLNQEKDVRHVEQITGLNDQIKSLKSSYEQLREDYYNLDKTMEMEKNKELKNLAKKYEDEIGQINKESKQKEQDLQNLILGSENDVQIKLAEAQEQIKISLNMKDQLVQEYEIKMQELHKLLDKQTMEFSESQNASKIKIEEYKVQISVSEKLMNEKKNDWENQRNQMNLEIDEKKNLINTLTQKISKLESSNKEKDLMLAAKNSEIDNQKKTIEKSEIEIKLRIDELMNLQAKNEEKSSEMAFKLKQIKEYKTIVESLQKKLTEKDKELKEALNQIKDMNEESKEMENYSKSATTNYEIQIQTLQRALEELNQERVSERSTLDRLKLKHEVELMDCISKMKRETEQEIEKFNKKRDKDICAKEKNHQEELKKSKDEFLNNLEEERSKASKIIEKLKIDLDQIKSDLNSKIKSKEKQVSNAEEQLGGKEKEIKIINLQIKDLKEELKSMKKENQKLLKTNSEKGSETEKLIEEIEKLKMQVDEYKVLQEKFRKTTQIQDDMNEKYNKLSAELDIKWADTLRRETGRLRNDLMDNFSKEKQKLIEKFEKEKNVEMEAIKKKYEDQETNLLNSIMNYENELQKLQTELNHLKNVNNDQTIQKVEEFQTMLSESQLLHTKEIQTVKSAYKMKIRNLKQKFNDDKSQYMSEMQNLVEGTNNSWNEKHINLISSMTADHEKKMKIKLDEIENKYLRQINDQIQRIQSEMSDKTKVLVDEYKEESKSLQKQKVSLEEQKRALEISLRSEIEIMLSEKLKKESACAQLENHSKSLVKENEYLKKQLDDFGNDYNKSQREFSEKLKNQESEFRRNHEQTLINNKTKYEEEAKQALIDFNKAENLYKNKIKELNNKLLEFEDHYVNRPSRSEDVEIIETLKAQLRISEKEIEKLNEEKRLVRLELVNKETNFNKIFNASPNVGVMTPSQGSIKSKKLSSEKMKTFPKLTPLPGSPFHDDLINPTKPLPPSSRKSFDNS